jgi:hypothetical protein
MAAIRFVCKTDNRKKHDEIKNRTYLAGGAIVREKIYRDTSSIFEGEMEIVSEGGTLYREAKELDLVNKINIIE